MAVGLPAKTTYADGDVFSASDINDTNGTLNLVGQTTNFYAGKNKIINGDFGVWQRGTSFSSPRSSAFCADRFRSFHNGSTDGTNTVTQETFTPGTAPVAGYEGTFFLRWTTTTLGTGQTVTDIFQRIENVRQFAGQTVTVSFWMKSSASVTPQSFVSQNFGSGGSSQVDTTVTITGTTTTSWQRFSKSVAVPSISGKTIGTNSYLELRIRLGSSAGQTTDIWGVQLEAGSVATAFQTATGTIQGELAACQRYYYQSDKEILYWANVTNANNYYLTAYFPVAMRISPTMTSTDVSNTNFTAGNPSLTVIGKFSFWAFKGSSGTGVGNFQFNYTASAEL